GASCTLNGLYMPTGRQHCDHHTQIDHRAPHCISREHYRGVLDGRARGVFNGKVVVHKGASGTDSAQSNANLLLSDKAEIDAKPELVIHHDDVKAAHGCTVGQLDDKQLFYLKTRGMSEEEARQVLTFAFADTVLTTIGVPSLRRFIEKRAFSKLPLGIDAEDILG
ncbi:MAG: SufD family Fe-S cluster assembly protein, partial [Mariprofundaceae bacterium]|nr:SufD family Fe-S cluster assembly protein [Mariprofundaceae bacterium]